MLKKLLDLRVIDNLVEDVPEEEWISLSAFEDNPVEILWRLFILILIYGDCSLDQGAALIVFFSLHLSDLSFKVL